MLIKLEFESNVAAFNVLQQFDAIGFVKFNHPDYGMVVLHHYDCTDGDEYIPYWEMTDLIICCYPNLLPEWAQKKHVLPAAVGKLNLTLFLNCISITGDTEPVVLTKKQQKKLKQKNKK